MKHSIHLPSEENLSLAGYAALINTYNLEVPLPEILYAISPKQKKYKQEKWYILPFRYLPGDSLYENLKFALKYEGIELSILKSLFDKIKHEQIIELLKIEPTGSYSRRIWFLYEWLQNAKLDLPDAAPQHLVNIIDEKLQYAGPNRVSKRHRVRNNLPGVLSFCPTIRKTETLEKFMEQDFSKKIKECIKNIRPDIIARACAYLLLQDSKASYAIEGETPPKNRLERWNKVIANAGSTPLSHLEFYRLQEIIISDPRFTHLGYRNEGGFIGTHDRQTGLPMPSHISAKPQDIEPLMEGLIETCNLLKESDFHPILAATIIAFGFVFIHPFEDGNGRLHRYLLHHVLTENGFIEEGLVFPISAVILNHILHYKKTLEHYSKPRLELIKWRPTEKNNIEVTNETIDLYRYYDLSKQAEFLFECIQETIEKSLPEEIAYLEKFDKLKSFIQSYLEMPDQMIELLIQFLTQGKGKLSKRALTKEFQALTEKEVHALEEKYREFFL